MFSMQGSVGGNVLKHEGAVRRGVGRGYTMGSGVEHVRHGYTMTMVEGMMESEGGLSNPSTVLASHYPPYAAPLGCTAQG